MQTVSLSDAKDHLSQLVNVAVREHETIEITRHGHPAVVLISKDALDSLLETLFWQSVPDIHESIARGDAQFARGEGLTYEEIRARLDARQAAQA